MTVSWIVTGLGVIVSLLGWFLTPDEWGWGITRFWASSYRARTLGHVS